MKNFKKLLSLTLAFAMLLSVFVISPINVNAGGAFEKTYTTYKKAIPSKLHMYNSSLSSTNFKVVFTSPDYVISNLKTSSKNLKAKVTYTSKSSTPDETYVTEKYNADKNRYEDVYVKDSYGYSVITLASKGSDYKAKVTFSVKNKATGKVVSKHTVNVYVNDDTAFKSVKLGKNLLYTSDENAYENIDPVVTGNKAKLTVSLNKGYKLKSIEYFSGEYKSVVDSDGDTSTEQVYKKVKNKKNITINSKKDKDNGYYDYDNSYDLEDYNYHYHYKYSYSPLFSNTVIRVTYIDKYTKETCVRYFYAYKRVVK